MKNKLIIALTGLIWALSAHAEVKIISTNAWFPTISGTWNKDAGLSYSNTVYGDTYYNSDWQDMSKPGSLEYMSVTRYFYLRPDRKRNWDFTIPITNLHAEKGYSYWSKSAPNRKQKAEQIYWGIIVGYKANGIERTTRVWLKRSNRKFYYGYEDYSSAYYITYSVDDNGWQESYKYYPSCAPNKSPVFKIETHSWEHTYLKWGDLAITDFPVYMEELTYIKVMVGTQAKIQIGTPSAYGESINEKTIYVAADHMEQENYALVKQRLYNSNGEYYEEQAVNLAYAYAALEEIDKALELCNALIKYNGKSVQEAYWLRGAIREYKKGQKLDALDDYQKAGDQERYNRLYNEIYKPHPKQQQQKPKQQNSGKPALTK